MYHFIYLILYNVQIHNHKRIYGTAALRDRFQFLMTLSAVMRSDSIYKADLCDLCDFSFKQGGEHSPYHILILRDGGGKSVQDKTQFGKVMRHRYPELCPIGALGLWLLARFDITSEQDNIDFLDNESWFNNKLLISPKWKPDKFCEYLYENCDYIDYYFHNTKLTCVTLTYLGKKMTENPILLL